MTGPGRTRPQVRNVTLQLHLPAEGEAPAEIIEGRGAGQRTRPVSSTELREAVVRTHVVTNLLVAYYAGRLRWMLAQEDGGLPAGRAAAQVVREILGDDGTGTKASNASRSKFNPLTNPEASGDGLGAAREDPVVAAKRNALLDELMANPFAIERKEVRAVVAPTGRVPGFLTASKTTESGLTPATPWTEKHQQRLAKRVLEMRPPTGEGNPIVELFRAGWLAETSSQRTRRTEELLGALPGISSELGYGTFALAATRLATDNTWRANRAKEKRDQEIALAEQFPDRESRWWKALTAYEEEARIRYERESGYELRGEYMLGNGGELKGWGRIRKAWLALRWRSGELPSDEELRAARLKLQKLRPEEVGDHALFDWLSQPAQWFLWDGSAEKDPELRSSSSHDHVAARARFSRLSRRLKGIDWTWPDPLFHPLWTQYGANGGSNNLPWRNLVPAGEGRGVTLQLIFKEPGGGFVGREVRLKVGENRRLQPIEGLPDRVILDGELPAEVGGGKLVLRRSTLTRIGRSLSPLARRLLVQPDQVTPGRVEQLVSAICAAPAGKRRRALAAYLSVALSVEAPLPPECMPMRKENFAFNKKEAEIGYLPRFARPATLVTEEVQRLPLRVIGVDLGLRHAASFSVVELRSVNDTRGLPSRSLPGPGSLAAVFTARGLLHLDGDRAEDAPVPPRLERAERAVAFAVRAVDRQRRCASALRRAGRCRMDNLPPPEREKELARLAREMESLFPQTGHEEGELSWSNSLAYLAPVLRHFAGVAPRVSEAKLAEEQALAVLGRLRGSGDLDAIFGALEVLFSRLDSLCIAAHRMVRSAVANPASVLAGVASRERRAARKEGRAPAPIERVQSDQLDMGGLSLDRLEFLERQLKYERKHASRPRPGQAAALKRRLSRNQLFMPALRERINRLKTDRCKKIAAAILEAALGGPADKLTGRRKRPAAHVIALEDLSRYKFFADRTKRENRQLVRWSHREVFKWVKMMADLRGIIVAAVPAGYSSRFSAVTGAPGMRTDQVRKDWLGQGWWKAAAEDVLRHPGWKEAVPGQTVIKEGGAGFTDVTGRSSNADENAAGNIAYRFLGPPALYPVYLRVERQQDGRWKVTTSGPFKDQLFAEVASGGGAGWEPANEPKRRNARADDDGEEEEELPASDAVRTRRLFRDLTGTVNGGRWTEEAAFWGMTRSLVYPRLRQAVAEAPVGDVPY